jgi:hypothetical protein
MTKSELTGALVVTDSKHGKMNALLRDKIPFEIHCPNNVVHVLACTQETASTWVRTLRDLIEKITPTVTPMVTPTVPVLFFFVSFYFSPYALRSSLRPCSISPPHQI